MNDLISRAEAIDELDKGAWGVEWDKTLAKTMIESLPSAQPTQNTRVNSNNALDTISRQAAIDEIINLWVEKPFGNPALVEIKDCIEKLPSTQPDEEKISDLLYDVYRLTCPQLGSGGVAVLKSYISMIYKEIFGEEGPGWMKK